MPSKAPLKIRRALLSVSNKEGIVDLARALADAGAELVATGRTAQILINSGLEVVPIEKVSGSPEAFQGRMKTLSFPVCSGILYRRGDSKDEKDIEKLAIEAIDCVVVNFYPFEAAAAREGISRGDLIEEIDIGGPTLVRAAAKNSPDVLALTRPAQYARIIDLLRSDGKVPRDLVERCASEAWDRVLDYDRAIAREVGTHVKRSLRYGENPHQKAELEFDPEGPIDWAAKLTQAELSYNNILDLSAAYALAGELKSLAPSSTAVVILKHNNPCGVATVPRHMASSQKIALLRAWEGDPVSAFGGVVLFSDSLGEEAADWLSERFIDVVSAPELSAGVLKKIQSKRKNLKAVPIRRFGEVPRLQMTEVPGGTLRQDSDHGIVEKFRSVTQTPWRSDKDELACFGVVACRSLKSNAVAIVREFPGEAGVFQMIGAGQGQPNRLEALKWLAVPRAQSVLRESGGHIRDCVLVSDAFFPFRDTVDAAHAAGIRWIVQPGGSLRDSESVAACDEHGIAMAFTGVRHFRH